VDAQRLQEVAPALDVVWSAAAHDWDAARAPVQKLPTAQAAHVFEPELHA